MSAAGSGSARRWRIACGFCAVVTFTVVAGYYVPLYREAKQLRQSREVSTEERAALKESLEQAEKRSSDSQAQLQELGAKLEAEKTLSTEIEERILRLKQSLTTRFGRLVRAKMLNLSSARDRVSIAVAIPALFVPGRPELTTEGRSLLCQLSRAIMAEHSGEIRVAGYYGKPRLEARELAARRLTPWEWSAARAATSVNELENGCGVPTDRLLVVGYGPRTAGPLGENVALEFIFRTSGSPPVEPASSTAGSAELLKLRQPR